MGSSSDEDNQPSGSRGFQLGVRPTLKSPPTAPKLAERVESEKSKTRDSSSQTPKMAERDEREKSKASAESGTPRKAPRVEFEKSKRDERKEPRASGSVNLLTQMLKRVEKPGQSPSKRRRRDEEEDEADVDTSSRSQDEDDDDDDDDNGNEEVVELDEKGNRRTRPRTSPVWNWFQDHPTRPKYVLCKIVVNRDTGRVCNHPIACKDSNTAGMRKHLKYHKNEEAEFLRLNAKKIVHDAHGQVEVDEAQKEVDEAHEKGREILGKPRIATKRLPVTSTIKDYFTDVRKWPVGSNQQKRMDFELMLMMATTQLPFSFIDEAGFKR